MDKARVAEEKAAKWYEEARAATKKARQRQKEAIVARSGAFAKLSSDEQQQKREEHAKAEDKGKPDTADELMAEADMFSEFEEVEHAKRMLADTLNEAKRRKLNEGHGL